jgi:two-component system chemotaxis response regulator CheB
MKYKAIVIGSSAGGMEALGIIIGALPRKFSAPIIIAQHISPRSDNYMVKYLNDIGKLRVKEADEKEQVAQGTVYIAPPNYHLLVEREGTLSLTVEPRVNYARPSIDVLFESAADAYNDKLVGVILTGANSDGSKGLRKVKEYGGLTIVQDPKTAEVDSMPKAAISTAEVDYILPLNEISKKLIELIGDTNE